MNEQEQERKRMTRSTACVELVYIVELIVCVLAAAGAALLVFGD